MSSKPFDTETFSKLPTWIFFAIYAPDGLIDTRSRHEQEDIATIRTEKVSSMVFFIL